jgi:hypothetical protein
VRHSSLYEAQNPSQIVDGEEKEAMSEWHARSKSARSQGLQISMSAGRAIPFDNREIPYRRASTISEYEDFEKVKGAIVMATGEDNIFLPVIEVQPHEPAVKLARLPVD